MRKLAIEFVPGLASGLVGGYFGYLALAYLLTHNGWWVPILPGAFTGLACGQASPVESRPRGGINGLLGMGLAIYAQWRLFDPPFQFDKTFLSYLAHLHELPSLTLLIIAINGTLAYWWGSERRMGLASRSAPAA